MRGKRSKWISKLVVKMDPNLFVMLLHEYGENLTTFSPRRAYRIAKRWWRQGVPGVEKWGKPNPKAERIMNAAVARYKAETISRQQAAQAEAEKQQPAG